MAEGGLLRWKIQKVQGKPTADYSEISRALPDPPSGYTWVCDLSKREWQVVRVKEMSDGLALPIFSSDNTAENIQKQTSVVYTGVPVSDKPISLNRVGFVRHTVQSSDTFQGLCIKYKVKPKVIRQANQFSGSNLNLAPSILVIPINPNVPIMIPLSDKPKRESIKDIERRKTNQLQLSLMRATTIPSNRRSEINDIGQMEARAYLSMNDWNVEAAIVNALEDIGWSEGMCTDFLKVNITNEKNLSVEKETEMTRLL